jgi:hypothetical protein
VLLLMEGSCPMRFDANVEGVGQNSKTWIPMGNFLHVVLREALSDRLDTHMRGLLSV